jgi:hypothetical protein
MTLKMKRLLFVIVILVIGAGIYFILQDYNKKYCNRSFDPQTWDSCNYTEFVYDTFDIRILPYDQLPYSYTYQSTKTKKTDDEGVPLHTYRGTLNYHPVYLVQRALKFLAIYRNTDDQQYYNRLVKTIEKLEGISLKVDSAIYFPYTFDFALHGCREEKMKAPWYSGMAQGQALSLFIRTYKLTGDEKFLELSNKVYHSFTNMKGEGYQPWVSCIDSNGNLWLEEYPRELPCFTLNGMIFGIYGLYDYYRITQKEKVKKYIQASLTTIKENIHKYRNKGGVSYYCLKHQNFNATNPDYHKVHIRQLKMLYKITGDMYFKEMREKFIEDTSKE